MAVLKKHPVVCSCQVAWELCCNILTIVFFLVFNLLFCFFFKSLDRSRVSGVIFFGKWKTCFSKSLDRSRVSGVIFFGKLRDTGAGFCDAGAKKLDGCSGKWRKSPPGSKMNIWALPQLYTFLDIFHVLLTADENHFQVFV